MNCSYLSKYKYINEYFDIIAEIHRPSLEVQLCEQSSREIEDQISEDVTLTKYLKRRKVKRK